MKYVVDIPESMVIKSALKGLTLGITMKVPSSNQDFVIPTNIQLEPYIESDIYSHTNNPTGWELYQDYQKAKEKYETWKKQKDQICVGDEVIYRRNKYIVGYVGEDEVYHLVDQCWLRVVVQGDYQLIKTGRHFNEVEELLKKIREV